jgi:A/G-specific adenine glycosylase
MTGPDYAVLPGALLPWYRAGHRDLPWRADTEPYHIWVSEIMLQQTRAEVVRHYYTRFMAALPTLEALAAAPEDQLLKLWEGLGYYTRARNLQKCARVVLEQYGGRFPRDIKTIRALPGVGPYTAGAVASICFGAKTSAVDGNVLRILARFGREDAPIDLPATRDRFARALEAVYPDAAGDFTQALMELGATVCTPKSPKCAACPIRAHCLAHAAGTETAYPVRTPKREKRVEEKTVLLLRCGERLALCRRTEKGVLHGLWQLPDLPGKLSPARALEAAAAWGAQPTELRRESRRTHIFTHIRWEMVCYHIDCGAMPDRFTWVERAQLRQDYALPTAFRMFLEE